MSTLLKWAQNTTQSKTKNNSNGTNGTNGKAWIHPPDALLKGHIAYLVKFMGNTPVDQPKGIDVVKEGIRKLQFNAQIKKAETGVKSSRKVELTISVDGVAIQEPKSHTILHQFPLHRISYCADDKGEKRFFSFIAKHPNPNGNATEDKHECFVFVSDKLAEEITLTIGQAFELAYKRFLDTSGKDLEVHKRLILSQHRIKRLEHESNIYKQRLLQLTQISAIKPEIDSYLRKNDLKNIIEIPMTEEGRENNLNSNNSSESESLSNGKQTERLLDMSFNSTENGTTLPPVPPRRVVDLMNDTTAAAPTVGTRLEGLLLDEFENDQDFDPRGFENGLSNDILNIIGNINDGGNNIINRNGNNNNIMNENTAAAAAPILAPPPKAARRQVISNNNNGVVMKTNLEEDIFGGATASLTPKDPFNTNKDPFEMGEFNITASYQDAIGLLDKRVLEINDGFSRGISFGNDDFSLQSLDPLKN